MGNGNIIDQYACDGQLSIFDLQEQEPPCYSCQKALRRGRFRVCSGSGPGYKRIGEFPPWCGEYEKTEEEQKKNRPLRRNETTHTPQN